MAARGSTIMQFVPSEVYQSDTPPASPTAGQLWQNTAPDPDELLRWTGSSENTARTYDAEETGASVSFSDLSDDRALSVTVKTVASQAGSGTPSPDNVRALSGVDSVTATVNGDDSTLTPDATLYGMAGYEDEIGSDGHVIHKTALVTLAGSESVVNTSTVPNTSYAAVGFGNWPGRRAAVTSLLCNMFAPVALAAGVATEGIWTNGYGAVGFVVLISRLEAYGATSDRSTHPNAFKAWLAALATKVQFVIDLATSATATVSPVEISGAAGINTVTSDGAGVAVSYTGSGWAVVGKVQRLAIEAVEITPEFGLKVTQVLTDGTATKNVYTRLYHGGLQIYDADTGEIIGGLFMQGGEVFLFASALADPRVLGDHCWNIEAAYDDDSEKYSCALVLSKNTASGAIKGLKIRGTIFDDETPVRTYAEIVNENGTIILQAGPGFSGDGDFCELWMDNNKIELMAINSTADKVRSAGFENDVGDDSFIFSNCDVKPASDNYQNFGSTSQRWKKIYAASSTISTSDAREKHDIRAVDPDQMLSFLMALDPVWFRLNALPEERMTGFIAQKFRTAMRAAGMPDDFGGYVDELPDHSRLALRYEQLIAPLVAVVQRQQQRILALEAKVYGAVEP